MSEEGEKAPSGGGGDAEVTKNEGDAQAGEAEANEEEKKEEEVKEEEKKEEEKKEEDVKEEEKAKEEEKKDEETKEEEKKEEEVKEEAKEEEKKEEEAKEEKKEEEVKDEEKKEEEAKEEEKKDEVKEEIKEEEKKEEEAKEEEKKEEAKEEAKEEEKKEEAKEEEKKEESKEEEKKEEVKQEAKEEEKKEEDKKDEGKKEDESKEGESQEVTNEQNEEEKKEDTKTESEEKKAEGESAEKHKGEQEDASKKGEAESDEKKVPETDGKKDEDGEAKPEKAAEESEPKGAEDQQEVKERASPETDENKATSDKEGQAQEQQTESAVEPATQTEKGEAGAEEKKKSSSSSSSSSDSKKEKSDHQKEETQEEKASEGPEKTEEKKQTATSDKEQDTQETAQNEPMTDTGGIEVKDVEIPSPTQERKPPEQEQNEETAKPPADSASTTEVDVHSENETKPESPGTFMVTKVDEPHIAQEESQDNGGSETRYRDDEEEMLRAVDAFNCGCSQSRKLNPNLPKATKRRKKPQNEYGASWLSPSGRPQSRAAPEGTTSPSTTYGGQQSRNRTSLGRRPISDEWKTQTYPRTSPTRTSPTRTVVKPVRKAPQKRALEPMQTSPPKEKPEPKPEPKAKEEPQKQSGNLTDDLSDSANLESSDSSEAPKALKEQEKTKSNEDKEDIQKADIPVYDEKGDHIKFGDSRARKRQNARSATAKPKRESDDQIDRILRYDLPPPSEQEAVLKQIRKDELHSIIDEEYESARRLQTAETILMTRPIRTREVNSYYTTNQSRLDQARNTYAQKEADWQRRMDDFDAQAEENMKKLIESQQEELKNFEEYWQDDKAMIPYTKASSSLISMRQHQKVCALTKDYDAALAVQNSADERQLYEEMNAEQKAAAAMLAAREQLLAKHQQQRECTASHSQRLRQRLEAERDKNLSETERVIQNRENNLNEQYEVRARVNQQTRTIVQSRGYNSMQVSPRTRRSLIDYRSRTTQTKLRVSGTNVTQKLHPSPNRSPPRPFTPGTTKKYGGYK